MGQAIEAIARLIAAMIGGITYRLRGGGFFSIGNFAARSVWGLSMAVQYALTHLYCPCWYYTAWLIVAGHISMMVAHGFCMDNGAYPRLQCRAFTRWLLWLPIFPASWRENLTAPNKNDIQFAEWADAPPLKRKLFDFLQMSVIGFMRGMIVFAPLGLIGIVSPSPFTWSGFALALTTITLLQPTSYIVGRWVPLNVGLGSELVAYRSTWCEFVNGVSWAIAFSLL